MKSNKIDNLLIEIGINNKEVRFRKRPSFPYMTYEYDINHQVYDDIYIDEISTIFQLYSDNIDLNSEIKINRVLNSHEIDYFFNREWNEQEKVWTTIYEFTIFEKGEM